MPLPLGCVPPCLPAKALQPPTGEAWLHEIKHDGFRVIAPSSCCIPNDSTPTPTAEAAEDAKSIPGARYVVIPSLQGHFAASPAKAADVEFMNRTITEFLETITEGGKKLK